MVAIFAEEEYSGAVSGSIRAGGFRTGERCGQYKKWGGAMIGAEARTVRPVLSRTEENILRILETDPSVTINGLTRATGLSWEGIRYSLNSLEAKGVVTHQAGGRWTVNF